MPRFRFAHLKFDLQAISAMGAEGATRSQELQQSHAGLSEEVQRLRERLIETEAKSQEEASRMQHESEELAMELEHIQAMGLAGAQSTARLQEEYTKLQADYETQSVSTPRRWWRFSMPHADADTPSPRLLHSCTGIHAHCAL